MPDRANRPDLSCVSLSDATSVKALNEGDFIVAARGRNYFSNDAVLSQLRQSSKPAFNIPVGDVPAADVYILDQASKEAIKKTLPDRNRIQRGEPILANVLAAFPGGSLASLTAG